MPRTLDRSGATLNGGEIDRQIGQDALDVRWSVRLVDMDGLPITTAFSAAAAALDNVGPGLEKLGPIDNYGWRSQEAKLLLTAAMLLGRLELMTVLMVIVPRTWRG